MVFDDNVLALQTFFFGFVSADASPMRCMLLIIRRAGHILLPLNNPIWLTFCVSFFILPFGLPSRLAVLGGHHRRSSPELLGV